MTDLQLDDLVNFDDVFGNHWVDGLVTAFRHDGVYVRWPDGKVGIFEYRHVKYLDKKEKTTCTQR